MKKYISVLLTGIIIAMLSLSVTAQTYDIINIYVSPNGADGNEGTFEQPLASVEGAKQKVQKLLETFEGKEIIVNFFEGNYEFTKTLKYTNKDCGNAKITYKSYNNEKVVFTGAKSIDASLFEPVTDSEVLSRIPQEARDKVGQLDLVKAGVKYIEKEGPTVSFISVGSIPPTLYIDDKEQTLAKWPNIGYAKVEKIVEEGTKIGEGAQTTVNSVIGYKGTSQDRWITAKDLMIEGFFQYSWAHERQKISAVDPVAKTLTTEKSFLYGAYAGSRYIAINLLEELDVAGEFYVDIDKMKLYFYPPYSLKGLKTEISVFKEFMFDLQDVSNMEFNGIEFTKTRGWVLIGANLDNFTIKNCMFTNIGNGAVYLDPVTNTTIEGCVFNNIGSLALRLSSGERQTLTSGNSKIINNEFCMLSRQSRTSPGAIHLLGVGTIVEHNLIHDGFHSAIWFAGNDHVIRYNEIYNVAKESSDAGAIYAGRDYTMRGTEISNNYIHDVKSSEHSGGTYVHALYLDDQFCGTAVHHNIINNANSGLLIGGGHDNNVNNNIFMNTTTSLLADNRGEGWAKGSASVGGETYNSLLKVPYDKPPYSDKYPELLKILTVFQGIPQRNSIYDNLVYASGNMNISESVKKYATRIENNIATNEGLIFNDNFTVNEKSPILEKLPDLINIQSDKIGIEKNEILENKKIQPFKKSYPKNGQKDVNNLKCLLKWQQVYGADKYTVKIAKDAEMKNVVKTVTTSYNQAEVTDLESGRTSYYWTVEAENTSLKNSFKASSSGSPYLFETSLNDKLDKTDINVAIANAYTQYDEIIEGDEIGEYLTGTKDQLMLAINQAKQTASIKHGSQKELETAIDTLEKNKNEITSQINYGYLNLDYMIKDKENWVSKGKQTFSDNKFEVSDGTAAYTKPLKSAEIICFDMNAKFENKWMGFALKQDKYTDAAYMVGANGYLVVVKKDIIEVQRANGGNCEIISVLPNTFIAENTWHTVRLGAINVKSGVNLMMYVDDKKVFNITDKKKPLRGNGNFVVYSDNPVQIRAASTMPETTFSLDATENHPDPVYEDMTKILKSKTDWQTKSGKISAAQNNGLKFEGDIFTYKPLIKSNAILKFNAKFNFNDAWQAVSMRNSNPTVQAWESNGYLFVIKPSSIELQRYNEGNCEYLSIVDNNFIKNGQYSQIEIASYEITGGVKVSLKVDGNMVIEYIDENPIENIGNLTFYDYSGGGIEISETAFEKK